MYKIFFKDRVIILTNSISSDLTNDFGSILKYSNRGELIQFIDNFEKNVSIKSAYIYWHNANELLQQFRSCFKNLLAAGGLVWDAHSTSFLAMNRLGCFDLPKGKVEANETFEEAAVREVEEECNIEDVKILNKLTTTFHTYHLKGQSILKETRWYEMVYNGDTVPTPQTEEDIEDVFWMSPQNIADITTKTYPSILEVLGASAKTSLFL
jgi:ADP-ribose pyrophosphatase YjhB (NUDIX family)